MSSALDLVWGRGGGRRLPAEAPEQVARKRAELVRAACLCTEWDLVDQQLGELCAWCGQQMLALVDGRRPWTPLR